jgi:outer membrane lipoprotein SlyB
MKKNFLGLVFIAIVVGNSMSFAKAGDLSGSGYSTQGVRSAGSAVKGEVIDVRKINIDPSQTASVVGKTAGAVIGGAIGAGVVGNNNYAKVAAGTLGGLFGGVLGDTIADKTANQTGVEVIVATERGDAVVISQSASDGASFAIGDAVWVVRSGNAVRAVRRSQI